MTRDELTAVYTAQMVALLPQGPAWDGFREVGGRGRKLLEAKAAAFARVHYRFGQLMAEALPWRGLETLSTREVEAGLPDNCSRGRATTIPERRDAVGAKWLAAGAGHRIEDFERLAARMGYDVTVTAGRAKRLSVLRCGDRLNIPPDNFNLTVVVHGPRIVRARFGTTRCGDPLTKVQRAEDLECRMRRKVHSHVNLNFIYED